MWSLCTKEYYSIIKKDDIISSTATWVYLKIIIFYEVSQRHSI